MVVVVEGAEKHVGCEYRGLLVVQHIIDEIRNLFVTPRSELTALNGSADHGTVRVVVQDLLEVEDAHGHGSLRCGVDGQEVDRDHDLFQRAEVVSGRPEQPFLKGNRIQNDIRSIFIRIEFCKNFFYTSFS